MSRDREKVTSYTRYVGVLREAALVFLQLFESASVFPPPLAAIELCPPRKTVHDVMERLEIVANPSKKERMKSWTGRQFL